MDIREVRDVVDRFVTDPDIEITGTANGEYNRVYLLSGSTGRYALRVKAKPATIDLQAFAYEREFMEKLSRAQTAVHVARNISVKNGDPVFEDEKAFYNLQTLVPGEQRYDIWYEASSLSTDEVREIFTMLAKVHNACRTITMTAEKHELEVIGFLERFSEVLRADALPEGMFKRSLAEHYPFIQEKIAEVSAALTSDGYETIPVFPVHYDVNVCNVLWEGDRIVSLVDFDWARSSTLEFDFCRAASLDCSTHDVKDRNGESGFDLERLRAALDAYNAAAERPFTDLKLITDLLDVSSLFFSHWAYNMFLQTGEREEYLMWFFLSGVDRLHHPEQSKMI